jgi:hypothetical protein
LKGTLTEGSGIPITVGLGGNAGGDGFPGGYGNQGVVRVTVRF